MPARPLLLAAALFAAGPASAGFQKAKFYLPENVPTRPTAFERAYAGTVALEIADEGRICSAAAVSRDGYLLTNLHCVLHCLKDKGWLEDGRARVEEGEGYKLVRIAEGSRAPRGVVCENLAWAEGDVYAAGGRVVWLGRGKANFSEERIDELPSRVLEAIRGGMDDFALLKYELPGPAACIPIAPAGPAPGTPLWGLGYPSWTTRYDGFDSTGYKKHITHGSVRRSIREDPYLRSLITDEERWSRLDRVYSSPDLVLSGLDSMPGSSGGPLLDASGRLAGLTWGVVAYSREKELSATALGLRIDSVVRELRAGLGEARVRKVFDCPDAAGAASSISRPAPALPASLPESAGAFVESLFDGR